MFFKNCPTNCEHAHTRTPTYYSISHYCKEFCVYSGWVPHIRQSMYDKVTLCTLWQKRQNRPLTTLWTLSCQRNMARYSNTSDQINIRLKITFLMHPIDLTVMKFKTVIKPTYTDVYYRVTSVETEGSMLVLGAVQVSKDTHYMPIHSTAANLTSAMTESLEWAVSARGVKGTARRKEWVWLTGW